MKHKHNFHFVRIYFKNIFNLDKLIDKRYATFIWDCGYMKEVEVKNE